MNLNKLLLFIEAQRVTIKLHKATLCSHADISVTYYNQLITGNKSPSFNIVYALLDGIGYTFVLTPKDLMFLKNK